MRLAKEYAQEEVGELRKILKENPGTTEPQPKEEVQILGLNADPMVRSFRWRTTVAYALFL